MGNEHVERPWLKNYDKHVPPKLNSTPTDKSLVNYLTLRYHCVSRNGTYFQRLIYFLIVSYSYN
jgi:hypothetical protein